MAVTPSEFYPPQDGDCVIQTSDDILFGVHRLFLKSASPVFSYMLGKTCDSQTPGMQSLAGFVVRRVNL